MREYHVFFLVFQGWMKYRHTLLLPFLSNTTNETDSTPTLPLDADWTNPMVPTHARFGSPLSPSTSSTPSHAPGSPQRHLLGRMPPRVSPLGEYEVRGGMRVHQDDAFLADWIADSKRKEVRGVQAKVTVCVT